MLSWPWCIWYVASCLLPWVSCAASGVTPGHLRWFWAISASMFALQLSVAFSPFRAQLWVWLVMPLGMAGMFAATAAQFPRAMQRRSRRTFLVMSVVALGLSLNSLLMWAILWSDYLSRQTLIHESNDSFVVVLSKLLAIRNTDPLGHANYLAGAAVLLIPWPVVFAIHARGVNRIVAFVATLCVGLMLLSAGSRGGTLGVVTSLAVIIAVIWRPRKRLTVAVVILVAVLSIGVLAALHPSLRLAFRPRSTTEQPNLSNMERWSMLSVAVRAGADRPLTGWGPGALPLIYDKYRGGETFGPINMLQAHSTPVHLWSEGGVLVLASYGAVGCLAIIGGVKLCRRPRWHREPLAVAASASLAGYAVMALTDFQLDIPFIAFAVAFDIGLIAALSSNRHTATAANRLWAVWAGSAVSVGIVAVSISWLVSREALSRGDLDRAIELRPSEGNLLVLRGVLRGVQLQERSLADPDDREMVRASVVMDLEHALSLGAYDEVANFALGWSVLNHNPERARRAFAVVQGVSLARRGVWLGTALVELNAGSIERAERALANECLIDPAFLASGWWLCEELAPLRAGTLALVARDLARLSTGPNRSEWARNEAIDYLNIVRAAQGKLPTDRDLDFVNPRRRSWFETVRSASGHDPEISPQQFFGLAENVVRTRLVAYGEALRGVLFGSSYADRVVSILQTWSSDALVRQAFSPNASHSDVFIRYHESLAGFGVRQRNPYAQAARSTMPTLANGVVEVFLMELLPERGWLLEDELEVLPPVETAETHASGVIRDR